MLHCPTTTVLSGIPDCLPSRKPVLLASGLQGETFIDQISGDIYTYDYANTSFTSSQEVDHDMAEDLLRFLRNQNQKWLKITTPGWTYQTPRNSLMLYIEQWKGHYFYKDILQ